MKPQHKIRTLCLATAMVSTLVACQDGTDLRGGNDTVTPEPASNGQLVVGPERTIDPIDHPALAFATKDGKHVGGFLTYQAEVTGGIVVFTPYQMESGQRFGGSPLVLETTGITIDDGLIAGGADGTRVEDDTVYITRGGVIEHLRNELDGFHQEWHFATAPQLEGDLVVTVAVTGQQFVQRTDSGLHFRSETDGPGVRYGHGLWLDSAGGEWPIEARYTDGQIALTVPASVLAMSQFPAVLDPTVGGEVLVDVAVNGMTGANSQNVALAFGGGNYLAVWEDNRNSTDADIWATRLSPTGTVLNTLGIQIANGPGRQANPTVAFDGTRFVVAWQDFKVTGGSEADIDAATVTTAGVVTQLPAVAATAANEQAPALAGRSGGALLVWTTGTDVLGSTFSTSFGGNFSVANTINVEADPAVAANPAGDYLVLWSEGAAAIDNLRGQFVTALGALSGASFDVSAALGAQSSPTVAFDGTNFATAWTNNNAGINVYGARVSPAGAVLDTRTEGMATVGGVVISAATNNQELSSLACVASGCAVIWQERRNLSTTGSDIYAQRLNPDFTLNGAEVIISAANLSQFTPALGTDGAGFFTAWHDNRDNGAFTVFGGTLSTGGAVGTSIPLVRGNNRETGPRLGLSGGNIGVFWSDSRNYGNDIAYVRFNVTGTKLDVAARFATAAAGYQQTPAASGDMGGNSLVVWSDGRSATKDIYAQRVSLATGVNAGAEIAVATAAADQLVPDVSTNGTVALLVWQDRRNGTFDIYGALVDAAGTILANDVVISNAASDQNRPAVAFDTASGNFVVVWSDNRSGTADIYGSRVSTAGVVLDPAGVAVSSAANGQFQPAIAATPTTTFVMWEDRRTGQDIYGTPLTTSGSLGVVSPAGIAISTAAGGQSGVKVGVIATSFVAAWTDNRGANADVYGQQVSTAGAPIGAEFVVTNSSNAEGGVSILSTGAASTARIAYEITRLDLGTVRVASRLIVSGGLNGQVCTSAAQCNSGFCVDGFCCDTACGGNVTTDCQACAFNRTGQPSGTCAFIPASSICRNYANSFCDLREYCTGASADCPPDIGRNQGLVCNAGTGAVCPSNAAPGPHGCP